MTRLSELLSRFSLLFSAIGLIGMTAIITWQVFARYVLSASPAWAEQASLLLMLWFILFAAAAGVREGFHIQLTMLQDRAKPATRKRIRIFCHLVVAVFGVFMAIYGVQLTVAVWTHSIPTLGLSRGWAYVPIALSGALTAFFAVEQALAEAKGEVVKPLWN
ncbi:TRAP transporter small permease [Litorimonas sp. WD9-15]|uniref:TRAP transporter small permease n=1 Tax=Litorimonas sp. WD9-15 TaxID=3418716 RepID=UPI003CFBE6AA